MEQKIFHVFISSLHLFTSFAHLSFGILIFFLSIYMSSLYIKDNNPLSYLLHGLSPALSFAF